MNRTSTDRSRAWHGGEPAAIAVCRPRLPSADAVLPYLRRIDATRWYSNHGPLTALFEQRLAVQVGSTRPEAVVIVANATVGLTVTLLALGAKRGTLCMMPAWTFAASAHAAVAAGLVPWFVDVGSDGILTGDAALRFAAAAPGEVGAAMAVAPFGRPLEPAGWERFRAGTGIPVVADAAAGFDSVRCSSIPTVVSMHATKVFAIGEGGFVTWTDVEGVRAIRQRINFGFAGSREARVAAINGKLSEYAAAVGLAALDEWPRTAAEYRRVGLDYAAALAGNANVRLTPGYGTEWITATTIVEVPPDTLARIEDALDAAGIASRRWWGGGLARHQAFAPYARDPLPVTDALAASTLGLPCWPDIDNETIARVAACVTESVAANSTSG